MIAKKLDNLTRNRLRVVEKYDSSQGEVTISLAAEDVVVGETELILEHKKAPASEETN